MTQLLIDHAGGYDLDHDECRVLLGHYGIEVWDRAAVGDVDAAVEAGERLGWDVVLKATAAHVRQQPGLAHVWRNIADADEMRHAWASLVREVGPAERSRFVVQRTAVPGVPVAVGGLEDPLFGPAVSFQVAGSLTDLVGDKSYRIPPLTPLDAAELVRSIKAAPLLFGYRGSEPVDATALEDLVRRVAQLKNDLPQVCAVNLDLVNASRRGVEVLSARVRVEPVADPRSDSFVRRLNAQATAPAAAPSA
ncbi:MAG: acetate--CoA ligase family protein [Marmoricola sp.]